MAPPLQPQPFTVQVEASALEDLAARLALARLPDAGPAGESWSMGAPRSVVAQLLDHWRDGFDWRAAEAKLNEMPQFTMAVPTTTQYTDGEPMQVHFVHKKGASEDAVPLLLLHGWPGSFWEFEQVLEPLTNGIGHPGGGLTQSFHVVAPSLPGYTFSEAPRTMGFDVAAMGRLFDRLMLELGYTEYVVQGGDWGAVIARNIGITAPGCKAVHVNMPIGRPPQGEDAASKMTEKEQAAATAAAVFQATETGYQSIQGTKPQTLGYGLHDSPVGLLAWLTEKFWAWSDLGEDDAADGADGLLAAYSMDELLTNISLYWFSGCITSSTRLYYETLGPLATGEGRSNFAKPVTVPCGIALFAKEPFAGRIQAWVEAAGYNVRRWTEFPQGGHFAAREQPAALVADMRAFVFSDLAVDERPATPPASGGAAATASSKL